MQCDNRYKAFAHSRCSWSPVLFLATPLYFLHLHNFAQVDAFAQNALAHFLPRKALCSSMVLHRTQIFKEDPRFCFTPSVIEVIAFLSMLEWSPVCTYNDLGNISISGPTGSSSHPEAYGAVADGEDANRTSICDSCVINPSSHIHDWRPNYGQALWDVQVNQWKTLAQKKSSLNRENAQNAETVTFR